METMKKKVGREQLLLDLYRAYKGARKHKRAKNYQTQFEEQLEKNLVELRDEIYERRYEPRPSQCFMIHDPKMREVFAADFRDRVVHHLVYDYIAKMFERTFIADTYSCIKGRGTHYGIRRAQRMIQACSQKNKGECYVLQMDISGYFMSINRGKLLDICNRTINKMQKRESDEKGKRWEQKVDIEIVRYLLEKTIMLDPTDGCYVIGDREEWKKLPDNKSLFKAEKGRGLPIGNLTSQLFSNVYLNELDQYVKRELGCEYYGRYVDDWFVVHRSKIYLRRLIPIIRDYLGRELGLEVHSRKTKITKAQYGVAFLGTYIKPDRIYVENGTLKRMRKKLRAAILDKEKSFEGLRATVDSYRGIMGHWKSWKVREEVMWGI